MITRFDHAVIGVGDLQRAANDYQQSLSFAVYPGGRHTGLGTENAIVRFGLDYLELLGIYDRAEVAAAGDKRALLLDFLDQRAGGLLGYALATDNIDALAEQFERTGLAAYGPYGMERKRPDGRVLKWRLLLPGGTAWRRPWPFFIQWDMPDEQRLQHERPGNHSLGVNGVAGVKVAVQDLVAANQLYTTQLGLEQASELDTPGLAAYGARYQVGSFTIDLLAPRGAGLLRAALADMGEGLFSVTLRVAEIEQARIRLGAQGIELQAAPEGDGWLIPPARATGARLVLQQKS